MKKPKIVGPQTLAAQGSRGGGLQPAFRAAAPSLSRHQGNTPQAFAATQRAVATAAQTGGQRAQPMSYAPTPPLPYPGATPTPTVPPVPPAVVGTPTGPASSSGGIPAGPPAGTPPIRLPGAAGLGGIIPGIVNPPKPPEPTPTAAALFDSDPRTMALRAWIAGQRGSLQAQYGLVPRIVNGQQAVDANGNPIFDWTSSADTPYSVYNTLNTQLEQQQQNVQNASNNAGALFSGATAAGASRASSAYNRNLTDALNTFRSNYTGYDKQMSDLFTQLYPELVKRAGDLADAAKPPAAKPPASKPPTPAKPPKNQGTGRPASKPNPNGDQTKPADKRPPKPGLTPQRPAKKKQRRGTTRISRNNEHLAPTPGGWR